MTCELASSVVTIIYLYKILIHQLNDVNLHATCVGIKNLVKKLWYLILTYLNNIQPLKYKDKWWDTWYHSFYNNKFILSNL